MQLVVKRVWQMSLLAPPVRKDVLSTPLARRMCIGRNPQHGKALRRVVYTPASQQPAKMISRELMQGFDKADERDMCVETLHHYFVEIETCFLRTSSPSFRSTSVIYHSPRNSHASSTSMVMSVLLVMSVGLVYYVLKRSRTCICVTFFCWPRVATAPVCPPRAY
jgi:hypothetical protein